MPKISVIIPVYNCEKYIAETLDSVIAQTFKEWEAVCIDDGSKDSSLKILKQYAKRDERIKVITQKNSGVIVARNNGVLHSTADLIYPLDGDDKITPNALQELYDAFMRHRGDVIISRAERFGNETGELVLLKPNKFNFCKDNCSFNAALFRKSDFYKAGGYDIAYATALEDYDLWLNFIYRQNLRFYRVPKILLFYRIKDKAESRNWQHRDEHLKIFQSFDEKYPQIKKYRKLSAIRGWVSKILKKIGRFFFRIQDNQIKIFKIPISKRCIK